MRMRSGLFGGSIYWVLLVSGRVSVPKPLSQIQRSTLCLLQGLSPRPSLGGFGLRPLIEYTDYARNIRYGSDELIEKALDRTTALRRTEALLEEVLRQLTVHDG